MMRNLAIRALFVMALVAIVAVLSGGPVRALDIGPETPIANVVTPELGSQEAPAIAPYPGGYLAVYQDKRSGIDYDISGVFLDTNGNPVGESFIISTQSGGGGAVNDQLMPSVAFNGTNFLVVWADNRLVTAQSQLYQIFGARVSTSGTVIDPDGFLINSMLDYTLAQTAPEVASNGTDWEVVWQRNTNVTMDIYGSKVTAAGVVSAAVPVATSGYNDELPSIAWNGSYYFVGYQRANDATDYDAYGTLIYSTGSVYKSNIVLSSVPAGDPVEGAQTNVKVSKGSSGACIAVWQDARNSLTTGVDIYGARLTTSGTVYDTSGIPIYVSAGTQETPNVAWDGTNYVVSWRDRAILPAKLYGLRVDMYGNVVDDPCLVFSTAAPDRVSGTCSAFSGDKTVVLWAVSASSVLDIYGCTMATNGTLGADRVVSVGAQDQPTYSIAFDGTNFVLAWADKRAAKSAVYVARVTKFGEVLDPGGVLLYSSTYEQKEPAICWGGGKFLVTWTEGATSDSDVRGMRLLSDLTKLDATPLNVGTGDFGQYASSIAWNGTDFLAVWADTKQGSTNYQVDIVGARVNPTTGVITRVLTNGFDGICTETHDQFYPAVASDGSGWLVTWQDMRGANVDVYFARVDNTGAVQGTPNGALVSTAVGTKMVPSVAFDGTCYLIVWADYRTSIMYGDIYGVRMNVNGTRADANDIAISSVAGSDQSSPSVAWAGDRYYVAWQDARNTQYQIYCTRVGSDGVVAEPAGLFVSSGGQGETKPRLSSAGTNWTGMLYSKFIFPVNKLQFRAVGEQVALPLATIGQSRTVQNGQKVTVSSKVVSAGSTQLTGKLYIEEDDRTAGICVPTASSFDEAAIVTVTGILATIGGERQITNATVSVIPGTGTVPPPLGLTLATLGGSSASTYVPGVTGGLGLNNLGLLVRVCGKVMTSAGSSFTLYDGSLSENIEVICPSGVTLPTVGKMVGVTGISSCTLSGSTSTRRVLTRKQADIQTFN